MEQIEIQYTLDRETLKKAYKLHFIPKGWRRAIPLVYVVTFAIFLSFNIDNQFGGNTILIYLGNIVAIALFMWLIGKFYLPTRWANTILKNGIASGYQKWILKNDGIVYTSPKSVANLTWSYFDKIVIAEEIIALYPNGATIVIVPTSAFTPEQLAQFKTWAKANVKEVVG